MKENIKTIVSLGCNSSRYVFAFSDGRDAAFLECGYSHFQRWCSSSIDACDDGCCVIHASHYRVASFALCR